jgi:hypothetical protein
MATAAFGSSLTYAPGGGGSLTQSFNVNATYTAISSGTIDIGVGTASGVIFGIPFGGVNTDARGLVIKNNTKQDLGIRINGVPAAPATLYRLAPGGVFMHWAPVAAGASALTAAAVDTTVLAADAGSVDYIVLGN